MKDDYIQGKIDELKLLLEKDWWNHNQRLLMEKWLKDLEKQKEKE